MHLLLLCKFYVSMFKQLTYTHLKNNKYVIHTPLEGKLVKINEI